MWHWHFMWWVHWEPLWLPWVSLFNQSLVFSLKEVPTQHGEQSVWVQLHCCTRNCSCWNLSMSLLKDFWGLLIFCCVFLPLLGLKTFYMFIEFFQLQNLVKSCVKCWWHQPYTFSEDSPFTLVPKNLEGTWVPLDYCIQEGDSRPSLNDLWIYIYNLYRYLPANQFTSTQQHVLKIFPIISAVPKVMDQEGGPPQPTYPSVFS